MKKIIYLLIAVLMIVGVLSTANIAKADDTTNNLTVTSTATGLAVTPPLKEISINAGQSFSDTIKVSNPTNSTLNIAVSYQDFFSKSEDGTPSFSDLNSSYSLAKWITSDKSFTLNSGETKDFSYTISVPANAEPGGHYGVIFFTPALVSGSATTASGVTTIAKIGSLLMVTVPGTIVYDGEISSFSTNQNLYTNSKNIIDFTTRFANLGTNHVKPTGTIVIKNMFGAQVANLIVNENQGNVLPQSIRQFTNEWSKNYGFGWYKAQVNLTYANNQNLTSDLTFWIIPWKETVGGVLVLILIIWLFSNLTWKNKNKKQTF